MKNYRSIQLEKLIKKSLILSVASMLFILVHYILETFSLNLYTLYTLTKNTFKTLMWFF